MKKDEKALVFEISRPGRAACSLPECDVPEADLTGFIPENLLRDKAPDLPEVSEVDLVRHYTRLSQRNFGMDSGFYPLGSCTMKYNPKVNEDVASLSGFVNVHPCQDDRTVQGCLELIWKTDRMLCEITGMDKFTFQPAAGAHGELTGLMIIKAWHESRGDNARKKIIIPDSAHGTNPASAATAGFEVVEIKSDENGLVNPKELEKVLDNETAGLMLTNPNTLGLFEKHIPEIARMVHEAGGLLYYDGANMNAIMGIARPGDMGFDVVHLNLHKTFSTPHGGGGPGAGPVGVVNYLVPFLPKPTVEYDGHKFYTDCERPLSIGRVKSFYGNFTVAVKAYAYILSMGAEGLREASRNAVLNANYILAKLKDVYYLPHNRHCMHEVVFSAESQKKLGVTALDIAKRLIDYGFHPPTIYFPLIVKEALMIEPTETESKETLDEFIQAMLDIDGEARTNPEMVKSAPHDTVVSRLDEVMAARHPKVRYQRNTK